MRGLRNNNPLNIRHSADQWDGTAETQTDKDFVQFQSMAYGYRAAWRILNIYYKKLKERKKHFTVENIIHRWAPPTENDTEAYIRSVTKLTGIGREEKLLSPFNVESYPKLSRLIAAMTTIENGIPMTEVNRDAILEGYLLAFPDHRPALMKLLAEYDEYKDW